MVNSLNCLTRMGNMGRVMYTSVWQSQLGDNLRSCGVFFPNKGCKGDITLGRLNDSIRPNSIAGMDFTPLVNGKYIVMKVDFLPRRVQVDIFRADNWKTMVRSVGKWVRVGMGAHKEAVVRPRCEFHQ